MSKKSTKYFGIWIIAFFVLGIIIALFSIYYAYANNLDTIDIPKDAKSMIGIAVLALFCPPLYIIYKVAKNEKTKSIMILSICFLVLICVCVLSTIIS